MGATNKTTIYKLPIFVPTDKPTWLGDFNGAMNSIEAGLVDAKNSSTTVIQTANTALNIANQAETNVQSATTAANNAVALANTANTNATEAKTSANNAVNLANTAKTNATEAKTSANNAISVANAASAELASRLNPVSVTLTSTNAAVIRSKLTVKNRRAVLYLEYDGGAIGTLADWERKVLGNIPTGYRPPVRLTSSVPFHPHWVGEVAVEGAVTLVPSVRETHAAGTYTLLFTWDLD